MPNCWRGVLSFFQKKNKDAKAICKTVGDALTNQSAKHD
jgi:hypothetical protein